MLSEGLTMSRALERAYSVIARGAELLGMETVSQFRMENERTADMALVTDGTGGFKLVPTGGFGGGGITVPPPPLGSNLALTTDPAGVVKWGGTISSGSF
jgi:hypothetical protein